MRRIAIFTASVIALVFMLSIDASARRGIGGGFRAASVHGGFRAAGTRGRMAGWQGSAWGTRRAMAWGGWRGSVSSYYGGRSYYFNAAWAYPLAPYYYGGPRYYFNAAWAYPISYYGGYRVY
jgi:hypothetical protein